MDSNTSQLIPYPAGVLLALLRAPIAFYRAGLGGLINRARVMILTTRGRKSGLARHTAIEYRRHGSKLYLISLWGQSPHWYRNLEAFPQATVQLGGQTYGVSAQLDVDNSEALRVLHQFRRTAPIVYDPVLARISSQTAITPTMLPEISDQFTIVRLDPLPGTPPLEPLPRDLLWVWGAVGGLALMVALLLFRSGQKHPDHR
jgi:deazaflavin-dependent oxidoreductase (nitroreductase family)